MKDRSSLFWALVLIVLGTIFLFENLDLLDFSFSRLWKFWPLILIYLGIKTVSGESKQASLITFILGLVLLGWLVAEGFRKGPVKEGNMEEDTDSESFFDGINSDVSFERRATLNPRIQAPVLIFDLNRAEGMFKLKEGDEGEILCKAEGSDASLSLEEPGDSSQAFTVLGNTSGNAGENDATILLDPNREWDIEGELGYSESKLNFGKIKLRALKLKLLRGDNSIFIGDSKQDTLRVSIHSDNASLLLKVPNDIRARVNVDKVNGTQNIERFDAKKSGQGQELFETKPKTPSRRFIDIQITGEVNNLRMGVY
jgi:hypothetical protein